MVPLVRTTLHDSQISSTARVRLNLQLWAARRLFERAYFRFQLAKAKGNISQVAWNVGMERTGCYRKLWQIGVISRRPTSPRRRKE